MKSIFLLSAIFYYLVADAQPIEWPHHKKAVIVLTYDDALLSQLDTAVPQLKHAGFKATFFLTSDLDYITLPRWRKLAKEGFELGNHTAFHPCPNSPDNQVSSDNYTAFQMLREIEVMNRFLYAMDGRTDRTYAYPCAETTVGGRDYVDTLRRTGLVRYARIGGDMTSVITDFSHLDLLRVPAVGLEDHTDGGSLVAFVRKVRDAGGMGVFMFHGIGGDYITTSSEAHQELLDFLRKNKKDIWVATFQQAMDYVMKNRQGGGAP